MTSLNFNYIDDSFRRDKLISWMKETLRHSFILNMPNNYAATFRSFEALIEEDRANRETSKLRQLVPTISTFYTPLPLERAFEFYDSKYSISQRRHVTPSFNEIRHILNIAQIMALSKSLRMVTFDGDQTLYDDGGNFSAESILCVMLCKLLQAGISVVLVTAAGYGYDCEKYEARLTGFLEYLEGECVEAEAMQRFYVMGGECNYLMQLTAEAHLRKVDETEWQNPALPGPKPRLWPESEVKQVLDVAEHTVRSCVTQLQLRAKVIRKDRAIGLVPGGKAAVDLAPKGHGSNKIKQEALNEVALAVQEALRTATPQVKLPFCAFNGGRDTWIDVGNKSVGVQVMQAFLRVPPETCLHVGDQFLSVGNDIAARSSCPCLWIQSPNETIKVLEHMLRALGIEMKMTSAEVKHELSGRMIDVYTGEGLSRSPTTRRS
eukprot:TRINITY_DN19256_c0_g1_i1.p1 TRINITY_DN19256_c0_g1~~TRINITY_DN19256_c0_g1_i1.p1  ORF type:complete len:435 (-),score=73.72 TRINITY_DN19256_c0_g1_i1:227-1531(-)